MKVLVNFSGLAIFDVKHLDTLAAAIVVERKGYGKDAKFLPNNDVIDFELVHDSQIITSETETVELLRKNLKESEAQKSTEWMKAYNAENENKKLKEEIATLKSLCPHTDGMGSQNTESPKEPGF